MNPRLALSTATAVLCAVIAYFFVSGKLKKSSDGTKMATPSAASTSNGVTSNAPGETPAAADPAASAATILTTLPVQNFSDQELQTINSLPPQDQAERLMMAAVNHYDGAPKLIMERADGWRGHVKKTENWDTVDSEARSSSDLRVRNAAIEMDLTIFGFEKNSGSVDRLMSDAPEHVGNRGFDFYMLGMLGNRGIDSGRIHSALKGWAHDADEGTRYWAIEGLAYLGSDDTIPDFLDVLRNDPSMNVRQRCAVSLVKSGMMTREQRMQAVPGLIEIAADGSAGAATQGWAFQALREITAEQIGNDVSAWRSWFADHGTERVEQFRRADPNLVLGSS